MPGQDRVNYKDKRNKAPKSAPKPPPKVEKKIEKEDNHE